MGIECKTVFGANRKIPGAQELVFPETAAVVAVQPEKTTLGFQAPVTVKIGGLQVKIGASLQKLPVTPQVVVCSVTAVKQHPASRYPDSGKRVVQLFQHHTIRFDEVHLVLLAGVVGAKFYSPLPVSRLRFQNGGAVVTPGKCRQNRFGTTAV